MLLNNIEIALPSRDKLASLKLLRKAHFLAKMVDLGGPGAARHHTTLKGLEGLGIKHHGGGVYSFPYLDTHYCAGLRHQFTTAEYCVNAEEVPEAQIPEIVLEARSKPLFDCLQVLFESLAVPLSQVLLCLEPVELTSIQAAEYTADGVRETAFHTDRDSDVTLVVNLGSEFEGGGTELYPDLHSGCITVPPLPTGHALLFKGRSTLHRGLPVTEGTRTLLVHWSKT